MDSNVGWSNTFSKDWNISSILGWIALNFVQTFLVPWGWIPLTFVIFWLFLWWCFCFFVKYLHKYWIEFHINTVHTFISLSAGWMGNILTFHHHQVIINVCPKLWFIVFPSVSAFSLVLIPKCKHTSSLMVTLMLNIGMLASWQRNLA